MKFRNLFFAFSLVIVFSFAAWAAPEKGMNPAGEGFVKAIKANDLEAVMALYAPDAVMFPPDAVAAQGAAEIRRSYADMLDHFTVKDIVLSDAWHETHGDVMLGWGRFVLTMVPKAGGEPVQMEGRFTDVSKKVGGKWVYILDHASVPLPSPPPPAK